MLCFKTITAKTKNQSMHTQQETQHASPAILNAWKRKHSLQKPKHYNKQQTWRNDVL